MIILRHAKGQKTFAKTSVIALEHWFLVEIPETPLPENPECLKVYVDPRKFCRSDHILFLPTIIGAVERKYGTSPRLENKDLETDCLKILEWLDEQGDLELVIQ